MKLLVIGCGSIGMRHAQNACALGDVAVLETDVVRRDKAASLGIDVFDGLEPALAWGADGIVIATPHDSHMTLAAAAIGHCRALLIEKPFGMKACEMDRVLADADLRDTAIYGVCNMRYHPALRVLADHVANVGRPIFARAHYGNYLPDMRPDVDYRTLYAASGGLGGALLDGVHEVDLVQWLLGKASVRGAELARSGALDIGSNDYAALWLDHDTGARSEVHIDYLRRIKLRGLEVTGHNGTVIWESIGKNPERAHVLLRTASDTQTHTLFNDDDVDGKVPYQAMLADFAAALEGRPHLLQTGAEARRIAGLVLPLLEQEQPA